MLMGGTPVLPVLEVVSAIVPTVRQKDVGIAISSQLFDAAPFYHIENFGRTSAIF